MKINDICDITKQIEWFIGKNFVVTVIKYNKFTTNNMIKIKGFIGNFLIHCEHLQHYFYNHVIINLITFSVIKKCNFSVVSYKNTSYLELKSSRLKMKITQFILTHSLFYQKSNIALNLIFLKLSLESM